MAHRPVHRAMVLEPVRPHPQDCTKQKTVTFRINMRHNVKIEPKKQLKLTIQVSLRQFFPLYSSVLNYK